MQELGVRIRRMMIGISGDLNESAVVVMVLLASRRLCFTSAFGWMVGWARGGMGEILGSLLHVCMIYLFLECGARCWKAFSLLQATRLGYTKRVR